MVLHVTRHALVRFRERVADVPDREARQALSGRAFETAEMIGAPVVILPAGQRAVIKGKHIVTVLPKGVHVFTDSTHHRDDL